MSELIKKIEKINMDDYRVRILVILAFTVLSRVIMYLLFGVLKGDFSWEAFVSGINRYDSSHYRRIILDGYPLGPINLMGEAGWAFFPLYPTLIKVIFKVTGLELYTIAFFTGIIFLTAAIYFAMKYMALTGCDLKGQYIYAFIMTFGCYSFYFNLLYTEAFYIMLLVLGFYFLEKKSYLACGICGLLMSATRNMGVFFVLVMAARWFMFFLEDNKSIREQSFRERTENFWRYFVESLKNPGLVLGVCIVPAGLFGFMLYLNSLVGDGLAFVNVQYGWRRVNTFFVINLINGLKEIDTLSSYLAIWALAGFWLIAVCIIKEKRYHEALWGLLALVIPMQSALDSIPRYMIGAFIFYRILADIIKDLRWYNRIIALVLFAGYELILINGWIYGAGVLS